VVSPTLNTNEASLGIATVGIAFHQDPSLELKMFYQTYTARKAVEITPGSDGMVLSAAA